MSIKFRLIFLSTLLITLVLAAKGAYDYQQVKNTLNTEAHSSAERVVERLKLSLPAALYMELTEQIDKIGESEITSPYIYRIKIMDLDGEPKFSKHNEGVEGLIKKLKLTYNEYGDTSEVGQLVVSIDQAVIDQKVTEALITVVIEVLLIDILLVLILLVLSRKLVTNPLKEVIAAVTDIAKGEGDLTKRLHIKNNDEMGLLSTQINSFIDKIQRMVTTIISSTSTISETSSAVKSDVEQVNYLFNQQQSEIDMLAAAITQMAASTKEISSTSQRSSDSAYQAKEQANEIGYVINNSMSLVNELSTDLEQAGDVISELENTVKNMSGVIDVIKSIADQTNLLALNAAIEAARAGELGRGFAVVADEVRALASRTQHSIEEIGNMITALHHGTNSAVSVVRESKSKGDMTNQAMTESVDFIDKIIVASDNISEVSLLISTSVNEQSDVSLSLDKNVNHIVSSGQKSNTLINQINGKADELDGFVQQLMVLAQQFKV